jgi:hypothetical protein
MTHHPPPSPGRPPAEGPTSPTRHIRPEHVEAAADNLRRRPDLEAEAYHTGYRKGRTRGLLVGAIATAICAAVLEAALHGLVWWLT